LAVAWGLEQQRIENCRTPVGPSAAMNDKGDGYGRFLGQMKQSILSLHLRESRE